jgi:excisionase family DNA binding protein
MTEQKLETIMEQLRKRAGLMSVQEVAGLLGIHEMTVRDYAHQHKLSYVRIGYRLKFDPAEVAEYIRKRSV